MQDSGPGMNQAALRQLRQRFSQAGVGESGKHQGSGLGLAICWKLTELMLGEMKIDSVEDKAARSRCNCPCKP